MESRWSGDRVEISGDQWRSVEISGDQGRSGEVRGDQCRERCCHTLGRGSTLRGSLGGRDGAAHAAGGQSQGGEGAGMCMPMPCRQAST